MKVQTDTRRLTTPLAGGLEGATVAVEPLLCGRMYAPRGFIEGNAQFTTVRMLGLGTPRSQWLALPIPAFLVHHPSAGPFLVDTGLHPSIASRPAENLGRLVANFSKPELEPGKDLPSQLRARGIDAKSIGLVVMTHLHFDHASGMSEFPGATFVLTEAEWIAATTESRPFMHGYRHAHYDYAFEYRTLSYDSGRVSSYSTFGRTFDLFGDGSIRLAFTPGHTRGHMCVILRLRERDFAIAGDAVYTVRQLEGGPPQPNPPDPHLWRRSLQELQLFHRQYPQAVIVAGHDPKQWSELQARFE